MGRDSGIGRASLLTPRVTIDKQIDDSAISKLCESSLYFAEPETPEPETLNGVVGTLARVHDLFEIVFKKFETCVNLSKTCLSTLAARPILAWFSLTKDSRAFTIHDNFFKRSMRSIRKRSSDHLGLR